MSSSQFNADNVTTNIIDEDVNTFKFNLRPSFQLSNKLNFQYNLSTAFDWFDVTYRESTQASEKQARQEISTSLKINWSVNPKFNVTLEPGVLASLWKIGEIKDHTVSPTINGFAKWTLNSHFYFSLREAFYSYPVSASESNPVLVKNSDLMWTLGNPHLNSCNVWQNAIYATYLSNTWLSATIAFQYSKTFNPIVEYYTAAPVEYGGLIKELRNSSPYDTYAATMAIGGSFLNRNLNITLYPMYIYDKYRGIYAETYSQFKLSGNISYTFGNFRTTIGYQPPYKGYTNAGMTRFRQSDSWNFNITYGSGKLFAYFMIDDIFHNKRKVSENFRTDHYATNFTNWDNGRWFKIGVSYTFGYGKKVDGGIDINSAESAKSSVLK